MKKFDEMLALLKDAAPWSPAAMRWVRIALGVTAVLILASYAALWEAFTRHISIIWAGLSELIAIVGMIGLLSGVLAVRRRDVRRFHTSEEK
ncbi:MAG: hypothetical protein OWS74_05770 [Firmicutes bacterium]|nr:hypothetical protein [Bacillota bacterium]